MYVCVYFYIHVYMYVSMNLETHPSAQNPTYIYKSNPKPRSPNSELYAKLLFANPDRCGVLQSW